MVAEERGRLGRIDDLIDCVLVAIELGHDQGPVAVANELVD